MTNSLLNICIAARTAFLIGISPDFDTRPPIYFAGLLLDSSDGFTKVPASKRPHVEALTKILSALLRCSIHLPSDNFSEIIRSLVDLSGILKTDSAKHIRATPSLLDKPYSLKKASNIVLSDLATLHSSMIIFALSTIFELLIKFESSIID